MTFTLFYMFQYRDVFMHVLHAMTGAVTMRLEGQQIGRYYFKQFIGTGGTGDVYLAEDPRIQQQVAIKVIQIGGLTFSPVKQGDNLASFRQEAAAIAKLNHPHIVHLNDYNEAEVAGTKIIYIVCPYYKAGSFANWLRGRSSNSLSLQDVADLVCRLLLEKKNTHQHQIIHYTSPTSFAPLPGLPPISSRQESATTT